MARLLALDLGRKRCGIAVTDPLQLVATALDTIASASVADFVKTYVEQNQVEAIIVGNPCTLHGEPSESMRFITPILNRIRKMLPQMKIIPYDERFTSVLAHQSMLESGVKRSQRQDKAAIDRISATILLNDYLNCIQNK